MSRRQGRSIPNALHSELPHTDQDGRINDVRAQAGEQKREAWCMIAVSCHSSGWESRQQKEIQPLL
jgi:hypothetical protein